jgi:hypothetical protein
VEDRQQPLADSPPTICALCGEPVDVSQTAVAVRQADGAPGLVHPACYPAFSAQQRASGNVRYAESPLRDLGSDRS